MSTKWGKQALWRSKSNHLNKASPHQLHLGLFFGLSMNKFFTVYWIKNENYLIVFYQLSNVYAWISGDVREVNKCGYESLGPFGALKWVGKFLPAAVFPRQVLQFEHTEDQRDGGHDQHEDNEDVFLCWSGDVTVHWMWTRPSLTEGERESMTAGLNIVFYMCKLNKISGFTLQTYRGWRKIP